MLEHNFLLTQHLETARRCQNDKYVAWLDISNAFGSVPRQVMINALVACGVDQDFVSLVSCIYQGSLTCILTDEGTTPPIQLQSGVKQGCPLSGILFNPSFLAFADDIVLMADSAEDLQDMMSTTAQELQALCLHLNPRKCATLHLSGKVPIGARPKKFSLKGTEVQALGDREYYSYLGCPVGFFVQKNFEDANAALSILEKLSASQLAQWQILDALKTFFPTLSFSMRTAELHKTDWDKVDVAARREIKSILSLPSNASNHYLYGNRRLGCCGLPSAAEDLDFYLIVSAFKLLTSRDEDVALQAMG
ncbi:retrovirus-related Pol polyprotein from type-1 retrotransposable element R2 [Trichonephila clavipes]|nr:retrovirus-related Pol polyprotein from type-1 retrotransposable element R2 [Trichonephila clavipes]